MITLDTLSSVSIHNNQEVILVPSGRMCNINRHQLSPPSLVPSGQRDGGETCCAEPGLGQVRLPGIIPGMDQSLRNPWETILSAQTSVAV